eukprot:364508-Chlamydomonas_euryale.AAC.13
MVWLWLRVLTQPQGVVPMSACMKQFRCTVSILDMHVTVRILYTRTPQSHCFPASAKAGAACSGRHCSDMRRCCILPSATAQGVPAARPGTKQPAMAFNWLGGGEDVPVHKQQQRQDRAPLGELADSGRSYTQQPQHGGPGAMQWTGRKAPGWLVHGGKVLYFLAYLTERLDNSPDEEYRVRKCQFRCAAGRNCRSACPEPAALEHGCRESVAAICTAAELQQASLVVDA